MDGEGRDAGWQGGGASIPENMLKTDWTTRNVKKRTTQLPMITCERTGHTEMRWAARRPRARVPHSAQAFGQARGCGQKHFGLQAVKRKGPNKTAMETRTSRGRTTRTALRALCPVKQVSRSKRLFSAPSTTPSTVGHKRLSARACLAGWLRGEGAQGSLHEPENATSMRVTTRCAISSVGMIVRSFVWNIVPAASVLDISCSASPKRLA